MLALEMSFEAKAGESLRVPSRGRCCRVDKDAIQGPRLYRSRGSQTLSKEGAAQQLGRLWYLGLCDQFIWNHL